MKLTEIGKYLSDPLLVDDTDIGQLEQLLALYPYTEALHWIYLRRLYIADSPQFESALRQSGIYIADRTSLYRYITYTKPVISSSLDAAAVVTTSIDYYALTSGTESQQSLQELAARLRQARLARQSNEDFSSQSSRSDYRQSNEDFSPQSSISDYRQSNEDFSPQSSRSDYRQGSEDFSPQPTPARPDDYFSESTARQMIEQEKYSEALQILRSINLNNPKKSAYFALQIRYLETIVNNHNKKE